MKYYTKEWKKGDPVYTSYRELPLENEVVELIESKDVSAGFGTVVIKIKAGLFRIKQPYCLGDWENKIPSRKTHLVKCVVHLDGRNDLFDIFPYDSDRDYYPSLNMIWRPWKKSPYDYVTTEFNSSPIQRLLGANGTGCTLIFYDDFVPLPYGVNVSWYDIYVLFGGQKQREFAMECDDRGRIDPSLRTSNEKIIGIYNKLFKFMKQNEDEWNVFDASVTAVG